MAMLQDSNYSNSSSNYSRKTSAESSRRSNTQASAYMEHWGGGFEAGSGTPSPPPSPNGSAPQLRSRLPRKRSGGAVYHITEECERLFCETLKAVFLVEKDTGLADSLVVDMRMKSSVGKSIPQQLQHAIMKHDLPTPSPSPDGRIYPSAGGVVREYVEVWDYAAGLRFRGFVAEKGNERSLFVFFDQEVMSEDLKPGLMALLELASFDDVECDRLVVGVDRNAENVEDVTRDLGWVGFELVTLDKWTQAKGCTSDQWLFLSMDV